MCYKVLSVLALLFSIANSQFFVHNNEHVNSFAVSMPHSHVTFQRYLNGAGAGGQKLALQLQQPHAHVYNTPLTHFQQAQAINHDHVVPHAHIRLANAPIPHTHEHIHEEPHHHHVQSHSAPFVHHHNPIKFRFSPSADVSSVSVSNGGIEYKF